MRILILTGALLLAACSSQPAEPTRYYLLRSPLEVDAGEQESVPRYALGRVEVAIYIDQPGLVQELDGDEISVARNHLWAEPLRVSLRRFLALGIGAEAGETVATTAASAAAARIDVTVDQLHGNESGQAVLVAFWEITAPDGTVTAHHFTDTRALSRDGYSALVDAQRGLLQQLARKIGQSI